MRETTPSAMPPCFENWCKKFDDCFKTKAQKSGFRHYLGGLLGPSERKNITQMADNSYVLVYNRLHHFMTDAPWQESKVNECRIEIVNKRQQTKVRKRFALIVDDSGHRKSGNFTDGVGRQYIGEIGKIDNGIVTVTTHIYDGKKSLPLDLKLYQHANSLPEGKKDKEFKKKPELALELIDKSLARGSKPEIILMDAGYGNNTTFLKELEERQQKYLGGIAKNRKIIIKKEPKVEEVIRIDELGKSLSTEDFKEVRLDLNKQKTVWVATFNARVSRLKEEKTFAIVMNANCFEEATEIDYLMTNVDVFIATPEWIVKTYSQRNWIEVFYREAKGWLGLKEYQVRDKRSLMRHFILVFCAYTFIIWHKLTGGLQRRWANKPLNTFPEALEAFRTAMSFRFHNWLAKNQDVFAAYKASLGFVWA